MKLTMPFTFENFMMVIDSNPRKRRLDDIQGAPDNLKKLKL